jgi:hypothetical protein
VGYGIETIGFGLTVARAVMRIAVNVISAYRMGVGVDLIWASSERLGKAGSWLRDAFGLTPI